MSTTNRKLRKRPRVISPSAISFGLAGIDALIDPYNISYQIGGNSPSVACIVGPDGVGKSILGLSAASTYASANHGNDRVRVVYASTDLNIVQARSTFAHFGLDQPKLRRELLRSRIEELCFEPVDTAMLKVRDESLAPECKLQWLSPFPSQGASQSDDVPTESFQKIFADRKPANEGVVDFLDLAEFSAGDDWGLINRIVGLLECSFREPQTPHLLVIDAVEGLETMAGNVDAFGLRRSRRSRLAQLVRLARKARCNLLFVIEQKSPDVKLDEVFISDLVIRLNVAEKDGYLQKTIEIEKARSVSHIRGIHELQIRDGRGASTDDCMPDDPRLLFRKRVRGQDERLLGYLQAWPSLHQRTKSEREEQTQKDAGRGRKESQPAPFKWFGSELALLDKMISQSHQWRPGHHQDTVVVSVGEAGTLKSKLAYAFLAEPFRNGNRAKSGAILITSEGVTSEQIRLAFECWNAKPEDFGRQVLVRPVHPRFLSSSGFLNRIKLCIRHIKRELTNRGVSFAPTDIRLVIDNWNTILESHPTLAQDPVLMQRVMQLVREEKVLAYFVGTQQGSPNAILAGRRIHNIGQLEAVHINTWPVDFFGDRRIAISSSLPGSKDRPSSIYELARDEDEDKREFGIKVLQHFDLYENLESGKAKRVDLRVKLYSGYHQSSERKDDVEASYSEEVSALFGDLFPNSKNGKEVVSFESIERYDAFKEYVQNMGTSKLDESLLFQVDEFWNCDSEAGGSLSCLREYFESIDEKNKKKRNRFIDGVPYGDFKIPLHKDFGIILADREAWRRAEDCEIEEYFFSRRDDRLLPALEGAGVDYASIPQTGTVRIRIDGKQKNRIRIADVWNSLCPKGCELSGGTKGKKTLFPSWEMFLASCRVVANKSGRLPFDVDLRTSESLSSLVLEMWFSKIYDQLFVERNHKLRSTSPIRKGREGFANWFSRLNELPKHSLPQLVEEWNAELDYSLRILVENLPARFHDHGLPLSPANQDAIAFRTWFAPAVLCQKENHNLAPLKVPGRFCVRGDWHLGVAKASRSLSLAQNAIDKLVSDSMNSKRFRDGVGLPVVDVAGLVESPLTCITSKGVRQRIRYSQLLELEPTIQGTVASEPSLHRIFRSKILHYDRDSHEFSLLIRELLRVISKLDWDWVSFAVSPESGLLGSDRDQIPPYANHECNNVKRFYSEFITRNLRSGNLG